MYWRSASWSSSSSLTPELGSAAADGGAADSASGLPRRCPAPVLTPRSLSGKGRSLLPPLQPLAIARRSLDEWPRAGSDDLGEWPHASTPGASAAAPVCFDKECSKVAEHIYLGGDAVAKSREVLRAHGITHVLNCAGAACPEYFRSELAYKTLWLQDSPSEDITSVLYDVFDYFEEVREAGGRVFVHCCQGVSRSTSLVIAYLMWRDGHSFDAAFQIVKAARGIANPNMGFACQLLQCQKRVQAIPLSPNSVLRVYRMAPHSQYDPLHLVPKLLLDSSPLNLDSRGAFIVHALAAIFVWIGLSCDTVMEKDAKAAAFQVVRYEKVQGQVVVVREGKESPEFWDAFLISSTNTTADGGFGPKISKDQIESARSSYPGKRKIESYDADYEMFYRAIAAKFVPPFTSSELPSSEASKSTRESNWSVLRRKYATRSIMRVYSDSEIMREMIDPSSVHEQHLTTITSTSPPFLSPNSLCSDSSVSSKYTSSDSPQSISPSTGSPQSVHLSPPLSQSHGVVFFTKSPLHNASYNESMKPENVLCSPSKGGACSIALRRGTLSPLTLPPLQKGLFLLSRNIKSNKSTTLANDVATIAQSECCSAAKFRVHRWPNLEESTSFKQSDLDQDSVLILVIPHADMSVGVGRMICIWVGSRYQHTDQNSNTEYAEHKGGALDWQRIGADFIEHMGFPSDLPVKVFTENERAHLLELLYGS